MGVSNDSKDATHRHLPEVELTQIPHRGCSPMASANLACSPALDHDPQHTGLALTCTQHSFPPPSLCPGHPFSAFCMTYSLGPSVTSSEVFPGTRATGATSSPPHRTWSFRTALPPGRWFSVGGPCPPGDPWPRRQTFLAITTDGNGGRCWWVETGDAAQHPAVPRMPPSGM